jgi:hypothetical protein
MRADIGMIVSTIAMVIVVGLIVRFHTGSVAFTKASLGGINSIVQQLENPGVLEQKVS